MVLAWQYMKKITFYSITTVPAQECLCLFDFERLFKIKTQYTN